MRVLDRQRRLEVPKTAITSLVKLTLAMEDTVGGVEVVLVEDETISDLHERFLGIEGPTDVITFPSGDEHLGGEDEMLLGEIVISTETAIRQAPEFLGDPVHETLLYVVHGVLHLLGYDDRSEAERRFMESRQMEIFQRWLEEQER